MWIIDNELYSLGGTVEYRIADFDSLEEAQEFLLKGLSECVGNPDILWAMVNMDWN